MAVRPHPTAAAALTKPESPDGLPGGAPAERPLAWWRLRSWRKDLEMLTRLRDGLMALPDGPDEDGQPEVAVPSTSAAAESAVLSAASDGEDAVAAAASADEGTGKGDGKAVDGKAVGDEAATGDEAAAGDEADADPARAARETSAADSGGARPDPAMVAIKETFARVAAAGDDAAAYFYASLFLRRPGLRELFPPAMDEQRDRLLAALTRIVESLSTPEEMASYLTQLGRDHRKFGVEASMYETVGAALLTTLRRFSGDAFTQAAEAAWTDAYAAASAIMIRAAEADAVSAPAFWTAEVVEREERHRGITVLTVAPDRELRYEAGQHLAVQAPRWPRVWRPYSIACCPRDDGLIRLHVKAIAGGWVSNALAFQTEPGDEVILGPPLGTMTLQHAGDRDLLCVAGGTGLSPVKALIEQVIKDSARGRRRQVFLFYGARRREELYDLRDLWRLGDAYDGLHLTPVTSDDPAFDGMQGNVGRVAARYVPHAGVEAYLSGPAGMVRETLRVLTKAGISPGRIHFDDALLASRKRVGSGT